MEAYTYRRINELVLKAQKPVFISDERIDGDSLGASLAMADYLRVNGVFVPVYVKEEIPDKYQLMPLANHCTSDLSIFNDSEIDLVISFDCSDENYIQGLIDKIPSNPILINIDHHATNSLYGHINQVIVESPATAEVVYRFFKENNLIMSRDAATCLMTGICFDTTIFSNSGTNQRALDAASDLIVYGARVQDILGIMFSNRSVSALKIWGTALERLYQHPEMNFISTFLTRDDIEKNNVTDEEVDGLSDFLNLVTEADTLFILRETKDGGIKVSMRSLSYNVANVAKSFGGGGHVKAAGFTIPNAKLIEAKNGKWEIVEQTN